MLPGTATSLLQQFGRVAAYALLYLEESGIPLPVPGDVYVMYIGHRAAGSTTVWLWSWLGLIAVVVLAASNLYLISHRFGPRLASGRAGRLLHLDEKRLIRGQRWFYRWGIWAIIFGWHLPRLRIPITVAADALGVPYRRFAAGVAASTAIWAGVFIFIGGSLSDEIEAAVGLITPALSSRSRRSSWPWGSPSECGSRGDCERPKQAAPKLPTDRSLDSITHRYKRLPRASRSRRHSAEPPRPTRGS